MTDYLERTSAVEALLEFIGENPSREGLVDTPMRVLKSLREMTTGYGMEPKEILATTFEADGYDELVMLRGTRFTSLCEHHMLPFVGVAHVGYLPRKRVVGLSKLARLVECYAKRLQIQERMTREIAEAMVKHLDPIGVGVVVRAHHSCMSCRGVRQQDAEMVTSTMLGAFRDSAPARAEFMTLLGES